MKELVNIMHEDFCISSVDEKGNVIASVVELVGSESVNADGSNAHISVLQAVSDHNNTLISNEINICQEFSQSLPSDANLKVQKHLNKCKTFPVSIEMQLCSSATNGKAAYQGILLQAELLPSHVQ